MKNLDSEEIKDQTIANKDSPGNKGLLSYNGIMSGESNRSNSAQSRRSRGHTEVSAESDRSAKSARRRSPKSKPGPVH